jgi:hypothetical protein
MHVQPFESGRCLSSGNALLVQRVEEIGSMRRFAAALLSASILLTPAVALAAPADASDRDIAAMADKLNDPKMQSALSGMIMAMTDMMMDLRIDKLRDAVAKVDPKAARDAGGKTGMGSDGVGSDGVGSDGVGGARTLGEAMARDNPNFRDDMAKNSRVAVSAMGSMASGMAKMIPQLREMAERMGKEVKRATRN